MVQLFLVKILSNLLDVEQKYSIQTPSFILEYSKKESSSQLFDNDYIKFPSLCELIKSKNNCSGRIVSLKVTFFQILLFKLIKHKLNTAKKIASSPPYRWPFADTMAITKL